MNSCVLPSPLFEDGVGVIPEFWASPGMSDILNARTGLIPAYPKNTDALEQNPLEADIDDPPPLGTDTKSQQKERKGNVYPFQTRFKTPVNRPYE